MVKRILRKYGYPPDKQEKATVTVLEQAEILCRMSPPKKDAAPHWCFTPPRQAEYRTILFELFSLETEL
jgi:hypothetical protein